MDSSEDEDFIIKRWYRGFYEEWYGELYRVPRERRDGDQKMAQLRAKNHTGFSEPSEKRREFA